MTKQQQIIIKDGPFKGSSLLTILTLDLKDTNICYIQKKFTLSIIILLNFFNILIFPTQIT